MDALKVTGTTSRRDGQEAEATNSEDKKVMQHKNDGEPNECVALLSDVQRLKSDIEWTVKMNCIWALWLQRNYVKTLNVKCIVWCLNCIFWIRWMK